MFRIFRLNLYHFFRSHYYNTRCFKRYNFRYYNIIRDRDLKN